MAKRGPYSLGWMLYGGLAFFIVFTLFKRGTFSGVDPRHGIAAAVFIVLVLWALASRR